MPDPVDNNTANAATEAEQPELRRRRDRRRGEDSDARTGTMPITTSDAVGQHGGASAAPQLLGGSRRSGRRTQCRHGQPSP